MNASPCLSGWHSQGATSTGGLSSTTTTVDWKSPATTIPTMAVPSGDFQFARVQGLASGAQSLRRIHETEAIRSPAEYLMRIREDPSDVMVFHS